MSQRSHGLYTADTLVVRKQSVQILTHYCQWEAHRFCLGPLSLYSLTFSHETWKLFVKLISS